MCASIKYSEGASLCSRIFLWLFVCAAVAFSAPAKGQTTYANTFSFSSSSGVRVTEQDTNGTVITVELSAPAPAGGVPMLLLVDHRVGAAVTLTPVDETKANFQGNLTFVILEGETSGSFRVTYPDDDGNTSSETATLRLSRTLLTPSTPTDWGLPDGAGTLEHRITIIDDEDPNPPSVTGGAVFFAPSSATALTEDTTPATVTVALSAPAPAGGISLAVLTSGVADGLVTLTASDTGIAEFNPSGNIFTIKEGQVRGSFSVAVADDGNTAPETLAVHIGEPRDTPLPTGWTVPGTVSHAGSTLTDEVITHTIAVADDDPVPTVGFAGQTSTVDETVPSGLNRCSSGSAGRDNCVHLDIELSSPPARDITLTATISGVSTGDAFFATPSGDSLTTTLTVQATRSAAVLPVFIVDDSVAELGNKVITVTLSGNLPQYEYNISPAIHRITLTDSDPPTNSFSFSSSSGTMVTEEGTNGAIVTIELSGPAPVGGVPTLLRVDHNRGAAVTLTPVDETKARFQGNLTFVILEGESSGSVRVTYPNDDGNMSDETAIILLSRTFLTPSTPPDWGVADGAGTLEHRINIIDNDILINLSAESPVMEGENAVITITANKAPPPGLELVLGTRETSETSFIHPDSFVRFVRITPTFTEDEDGRYTATYEVPTLDDEVNTIDGRLHVYIYGFRRVFEDGTYYIFASIPRENERLEVTYSDASVIIDDNDPPELTVTAVTNTVITEGATALFKITADIAPKPGLRVTLNVADEAGSDFVSNNNDRRVTLDFNGGTTATYEVRTNDDAVDEFDGAVTVTLREVEGEYTVGGTPAVVNVADNDKPVLTIAAPPDASETEGPGAHAEYTVTADIVPGGPIDVLLTVSGEGDFAASPGEQTARLTFEPADGTTATAVLRIAIDDDRIDEYPGTITAAL
ncbi:MAG: hypothetical protein OXF42_03545, partial [Candidatus Dadabacteria bacterium]|nr:hypothetical protein [Candidatus Dadabacteria bacterium]